MRPAVLGPMPGSNWMARKPETRSRGFCAQRRMASTSLTWRASRNLRPPNLTNGMLRRVSSISSRTLCARPRKSTACDLSLSADFAPGEDLVGDVGGLIDFVAHRDDLRLLRGGAFAPQVLAIALLGERDDFVGGGQDGLGRAVVAVERDDARRRVEVRGKVEDVAHRRAAEAIDRLRVVADHGQAAAVGLHGQQQRGLQAVGVLVLVDQHVAEASADLGGELGLADHLRPVEQQVVVVEHLLRLLGFDVGEEERLEVALPLGAPREGALQHLRQRRLRVDRRRVDGEAGALERKALALARKAELVADDVHQVGRVLAVVDGEGRVDADAPGELAQQPRADAVEGAGPGKALTLGCARCAARGVIWRAARRPGGGMRWPRDASSRRPARREKVSSRLP
jgi:hypothetical protein